ncbi:MAG TPA: hypothetical protein VJ385_15930 [Fibrobacteria bacterium]|nr:hypothetical protein [Fibrobacteria bacterium]
MRIITLAILCALAVLPARATVLGDAAANLKPGEWVSFSAKGWSSALITTGVDNILNYSNSGVWDPIKKEIRFVGQGHYEAEKMIIYDDATNTWRNASPPVGSGIGHGYDHNTINTVTGISYYRKYYSTGIYAFQNNAWSKLTNMPGTEDDYSCCGALVYFNDYNGLTFWGGGKLYGFRDNKWTTLKTGLAMGDYHNVAEYSRQYGLVFGGGGNGSKSLFAMDGKGNVTAVPAAPTGLGVNTGLMSVDPATGELLVIGGSGTFHAYYPAAKTWKNLPNPPTKFLELEGLATKMTVAIPIDTYGITMFLHRDGVDLYKHIPSGPVVVGLGRSGAAPRIRTGGGMVAFGSDWSANPAYQGLQAVTLMGRNLPALTQGGDAGSIRMRPSAGVYMMLPERR